MVQHGLVISKKNAQAESFALDQVSVLPHGQPGCRKSQRRTSGTFYGRFLDMMAYMAEPTLPVQHRRQSSLL
jgi:hypothetical protein